VRGSRASGLRGAAPRARARVTLGCHVVPCRRALDPPAPGRCTGVCLRGGRELIGGFSPKRATLLRRCGAAGGRDVSGGRARRRPLTEPDRRRDQQGHDGHGDHPTPRYPSAAEPWPGEAAEVQEPATGQRGHQADRRVQVRAVGDRWCLNGVVEGRRVLAPEGVRRRRRTALEPALRGGPGAGGGADRDQLLGRPQPVARKPDHVLLVASQPYVFALPIARFHGFADLSSVRVPVRLRGAVQYNPELGPVCLN
jgi:hypothetical protein